MLSQLAKLDNVNVISRTSVARYASTDLSIPQIAAELRVGAVMEGSVRYANDRVRIAAQLVDAASDQALWSDVYERDFADVFAIQADIAMNIANALQAEFSVAEQQSLERQPTSSPAAYALFLQALSGVRQTVPGAVEAAQGLLDRAIAIDPNFARAYGMKALLHSASFINTAGGTAVATEARSETESLVREYSQRALALDPTDGRARDALAVLHLLRWNWSTYLATFDEDESNLCARRGVDLLLDGRPRARRADGRAGSGSAVRTIPRLSGFWPSRTPTPGIARRRPRSSASRSSSPRRTRCARAWLAYNAAALGNADEALAQLQLVERLLGNKPHHCVSPGARLCLLAHRARRGRASACSTSYKRARRKPRSAPAAWPLAYLAVGDEDEALRWLEIGCAEGARPRDRSRAP